MVCVCCSDKEAFLNSVESITGPISKIISTKGINAVYEALDSEGKKVFEQAYSAAYHPSLDVCMEIYEVCEGVCGVCVLVVVMVVGGRSAAWLEIDGACEPCEGAWCGDGGGQLCSWPGHNSRRPF